MKFVILLILLVMAMPSKSDDKIKIFYSSPYAGLFMRSLGIPVEGILKQGDDGVESHIEALKEKNSFLLVTSSSITIAEQFYSNFVNPFKEMDFVALIGNTPFAIGVSSSNTSNTIEELIAQKQKLILGGTGNISSCLIAGKYIQMKYKVKVDYVFYKTPVQALADVTNNQIDMICRYGASLYNTEKDNKIKLVMKFTDSNYGILGYIPMGISIENNIVLLANKSINPELKKIMVQALTSDNYKLETSKYITKYMNFNTEVVDTKIDSDNKILRDHMNYIIPQDKFLTTRVTKK